MGVQYHLILIVFIGGCCASFVPDGLQQREKRAVGASDRVEGQKILVTGENIVHQGSDGDVTLFRKGSNVTLSLYVGAIWEDEGCRWFRYDHTNPEDFDTCKFELDVDTNTTKTKKCEDEMKAMIAPLSDDPTSCKIMLTNMSSAMEGKWAARLDSDMKNKEIHLVMEADVESVEVEVDDDTVIAGENVTVICKAVGGKPEPLLTFMLMNADNTTDNTTEETFIDVHLHTKDDTSVVYHATFVPMIADLGKYLCCKAIQQGDDNVTLYETNKVLDRILDVKFPPQAEGLTSFEAKIGKTATVSLSFKSNPAPTKAVFTITRSGNCREDDTLNTTSSALPQCSLNITAGESNDKYNTSKVVEGEKNTSKINFEVLSVEDFDIESNYTVTVTNSVGTQTYGFLLTEYKPNTTVTTPTEASEGNPNHQTGEDEEGGASPGVVVLLVIFMLMGVISGVVFYKKRQKSDIEQTPLTNTH